MTEPNATATAAARYQAASIWLAQPVDAASAVVFRATFGAFMLWRILSLLGGDGLARSYTGTVFQFEFRHFEWIGATSEVNLRALLWVMAASSVLIIVGRLSRWGCLLTSLGGAYLLFYDKANFNDYDYLLLLLGLVLALVPVHGGWKHRRPRTIPRWALALLQFQVAVPYVYGGLNKINYDWLVRREPLTLWLQTARAEGIDFLRAIPDVVMGTLLSWSGLAFDLAVVPLLLYRRTRRWAFGAALVYQLINGRLFEIGVFPWVMIVASTIYFEPGWPRNVALLGRKVPKISPAAPLRPALMTGLGLYVALQLLIPFRHVLYPGPVDWTEQGHVFSWRMKLRDKDGLLQWVLYNPVTAQASPLEGLDRFLTPKQEQMMRRDPDMLRQFAHFLRSQFENRGEYDFEVRLVTAVSLNARPPQPMIDAEVDLSAVAAGTPIGEWIVPLRPVSISEGPHLFKRRGAS